MMIQISTKPTKSSKVFKHAFNLMVEWSKLKGEYIGTLINASTNRTEHIFWHCSPETLIQIACQHVGNEKNGMSASAKTIQEVKR